MRILGILSLFFLFSFSIPVFATDECLDEILGIQRIRVMASPTENTVRLNQRTAVMRSILSSAGQEINSVDIKRDKSQRPMWAELAYRPAGPAPQDSRVKVYSLEFRVGYDGLPQDFMQALRLQLDLISAQKCRVWGFRFLEFNELGEPIAAQLTFF